MHGKPDMSPASIKQRLGRRTNSGGPLNVNRLLSTVSKLGLLPRLVNASGIDSEGITALLQADAEDQIMVHVILLGPEHRNRAISLFMTGSERCVPLLSVILLRRGGHGKRNADKRRGNHGSGLKTGHWMSPLGMNGTTSKSSPPRKYAPSTGGP
jgi:hypothetical protein